MTEENREYRTSQIMLRNQFHGKDKFKIPIIPKGNFGDKDFQNLLLIGFDRTNIRDEHHLNRMVHFFLYDYKFERIWKKPDYDIEKLKRYRAVLSPDFSIYREMNPSMQLYNTFRNRWCGAYFASKGIRVIPTVSWGDENTFDFCFKGIPKGSVVAVSTYMVSEHGNHADQKDFFLKGYREMLRQIEPERIICYNTPFPEMEGNIIFVDYELSSWKYQNHSKSSKYAKYLTGQLSPVKSRAILIKRGYVFPQQEEKGMGSAYGGEWKPKKPDDERFIGKPGEIKTTKDKNGNLRLTKIGEDGKAVSERHFSDHGYPRHHSIPHDHELVWEHNHFHWGDTKNYWDGNVPEFKQYGGNDMDTIFPTCNTLEDDRFESIEEFKDCIGRGDEIEFEWKGVHFGMSGCQPKPEHRIMAYLWNQPDTEQYFDTPDDALEYIVAGDRLRDIITQIDVLSRAF